MNIQYTMFDQLCLGRSVVDSVNMAHNRSRSIDQQDMELEGKNIQRYLYTSMFYGSIREDSTLDATRGILLKCFTTADIHVLEFVY